MTMRSIKVNGKMSFATGNGSIGINNVSGNGNINSDKIYLANNVDSRKSVAHQQQQQQQQQPHIATIKALYEELTKTVTYQNRGSDFITYLLSSNKANSKTQAIALLNSLIENGYLLPMNANAMDENSDGDRLVDFNENYIYRLLKTNDGISNNSAYALNLDVDNNSPYLNRPEPNMIGEWNIYAQLHIVYILMFWNFFFGNCDIIISNLSMFSLKIFFCSLSCRFGGTFAIEQSQRLRYEWLQWSKTGQKRSNTSATRRIMFSLWW